MNKCIRGLEIITPLESFRDDIIISGGKIRKIGSEVCNEEIKIEKGKYVVPGLIDIHTHGIGGILVNDVKSVESYEKLTKYYYSHGVTTFIPSTISENVEKLISIAGILNEAKSIGIHLEGPIMNPNRAGAHKFFTRFNERILEISKLFKIKRITVAPEILSDRELETLVDNFQVSLGHTDANSDDTRRAIGFGASSVTHLFNAMRPFHHRDPGIIGVSLTSPIYTEVIPDLVHVNEITINIISKLKGNNTILVSDSLQAAGLGEGEFLLYGEKIICNKACFEGNNKLVGSNITLDEGVRRVSKVVGLKEAIKYATYSPASLLNIDDIGQISRGYVADLVILDENLNVLMTLKSGSVVFSIFKK
ncbi:N-acetylglucosamine-6-phosphate deacetylase [Sulfolobus islandicus Y.N.15.51]|uniref:N-acetylglucosamine-6-phosphate deacetylase n=1 Tax=Saccharolobus islandicus (strain Y.N.15.51 / Yellowstone \|nr:N-acetylglucosamine-6-phosphate deacetylase [Sulfolobus islandicus]ACP49889.1 N-acetylglucosamine-6-phosphate deacetylase [Sulfolobus islandicus Y.N.15.51]PVU76597.1 N-acetylglucosamine-6-phosphate deacetylase [Sulfolobus islandicus]